MAGPQIGHYAPGEIEFLVEHDGVVLMELDDFNFDLDAGIEAGGAGLGHLHNTYMKRTKAPAGTWGITRKALRKADKGQLFLDLLKGSAYILTEPVAKAATTYTTSEPIISVLQVQEVTTGTLWTEGVDYTVNYTTHVLTFVSTVPDGGLEVKYLCSTASLKTPNLIQNGGFEQALTNVWEAVATGTVSQDSDSEYVGSYALKIVSGAQNDGVKYLPDIVVIPGNVYHLRCWIKGTKDDTFAAKWTDSGAASAMTGTVKLTATGTWQECDWTFTPDEAKILDVQILNSTASPNDCYVDEVYLGMNVPVVNPLDGQFLPFQFNVTARRVVDGVTVYKLKGCSISTLGVKSGTAYAEAIKGPFLDMEVEA